MSSTPITDALQASDDPLIAPNWLRWRVGEDGRSIYAMPNGYPQAAGDMRIGRMLTETVANEVVHAHNNALTSVQLPTDERN